MKQILDLEQTPFIAVWESTQTCDPDYCLATGQPERDPLELTTAEAEQMLRDVAELQPRIFVMAGGDPLWREDIYSLVCYAASCDLHPIMLANASALLTRTAISKLKNAGLTRLALALDAASPEAHDSIHGKGSFDRTLTAMRWANEVRLPVQIQTSLTGRNLGELEKIAALLSTQRVLLWSVSFPVSNDEEQLSPEETEEAFARLYRLSRLVSFKVKTAEAPHYRRYVLQQRARQNKEKGGNAEQDSGIPGVMPTNEIRGSLFIGNTGEVYPSACLPRSAGNVRTERLAHVYRESELFKSMRDVSALEGKCGRCNFKEICGGSRARALAITGDMFTADPSCAYEPPAGLRPQGPAAEEPRN
jgi:AdoMet-dependent heme synthase